MNKWFLEDPLLIKESNLIREIIHDLLNLYSTDENNEEIKEITTDFLLKDTEEKICCVGEITINRNMLNLFFTINMPPLFLGEQINENCYIIKDSSLPLYYKLYLYNFPEKNLKKQFQGEYIKCYFPKVKIASSISFSMNSNSFLGSGYFIPLTSEDKIVMTLYLK